MCQHPRICGGIALFAFAAVTNAGTITVNNNGDPGSGNCASTCTLRDAIATAASGDTIVFAPGLVSPITLTQGELLIGKALTITGPGAGALSISANNGSRVFNIAANVSISDLAITDGAVTGSNGTDGTSGAGESVGGACVLVANGFVAVLDRVAIRHCYATGGNGGLGFFGAPGVCINNPPPTPPTCFPGGPGGPGGDGGAATGAAIAVNGSLSLLDSSVVDAHATGGNGGTGGSGGTGTPPGSPGNGGVGGAANGGAVAISSGGSIDIFNSTIAESSGTGGNGGTGASSPPGAVNGSGGVAIGGLLYLYNNVTLADLEFSTLANGSLTGGAGTQTGAVIANAINAASTLNVFSSIVGGVQSGVNLCSGSVTAAPGSVNLSEDSSCSGFTLPATSAQLKPLDSSATPALMPIWKSPAIDAATNCQDLTSAIVTADQHGTMRPQGTKCDLGAIEADYIFVDGFGG
jgi:hypothetical protein